MHILCMYVCVLVLVHVCVSVCGICIIHMSKPGDCNCTSSTMYLLTIQEMRWY